MKRIAPRLRRIAAPIATFLLLGSASPLQAQVNAEQVMQIGRNVLSMDDYMLAIQYFNQAIKAKPYLPDPYYFRALAKLNLEDYKGAEEDCTIAIELNKFKSEAYKLRGFARQYMDRNEEAVADYDAGLEYYPLDRWFLYYKGVALTELKRFEQADSTFGTLLRAYPAFEDGYTARARSMVMRGDTVAGLADLDKALSISRNQLTARLMRADIEARRKNWKEALADLDEALRLRPQEADLYINRAYLRYNDDDWFGAMSDYNYALELEPDNSAALFNRALLRYETRNLPQAAADLTEVLRLDPDNFHALFNRGLVYLEMNRNREALADFDKVTKKYPRYYTVYYAIAEARRGLGDMRGAAQSAHHAETLVKGYVTDPQRNPLDRPAIAAGQTNDRGSQRDSEESETDVMERFNRLVTVAATGQERLAYNERSKGRVQDRNLRIEPEAPYIITLSDSPGELRSLSNYFRELDDFNQQRLIERPLYLTNSPAQAADSASIAADFQFAERLTAEIESRADSPRAADYLARGVILTLLKNYAAAIADLDRATALDPGFAVAYMARAGARLAQSAHPETESGDEMLQRQAASASDNLALADLDHVIRLNPRMVYAWYDKGVIYLRNNDMTSALQCFSEAIAIRPDFGEAYYNRGLAYLQIGNKNLAFADLSKAGELGVLPSYGLLKRMK